MNWTCILVPTTHLPSFMSTSQILAMLLCHWDFADTANKHVTEWKQYGTTLRYSAVTILQEYLYSKNCSLFVHVIQLSINCSHAINMAKYFMQLLLGFAKFLFHPIINWTLCTYCWCIFMFTMGSGGQFLASQTPIFAALSFRFQFRESLAMSSNHVVMKVVQRKKEQICMTCLV